MPDGVHRRPPATLLLVRHGESQGNSGRRFGGHSDVPLTDEGRRQAEVLGRALVDRGIARLVSSDLPRARETAEIAGRHLGLEPTLDPRWRERSLGDLDGLAFDDARARYPEVMAALSRRDPAYRPPGGESLSETMARLSEAASGLWVRASPVVVVTHQIAIHLFLVSAIGANSSWVFFHTANASITQLTGRPGKLCVDASNDTAHLSDRPCALG